MSAGRRWGYRFCAAVIVPLVIAGALELGLRLAGYGYPTGFFQQIKISGQDYFVPNDKFGYRFFPPALARTAPPQRMAVPKPPHAYRIFVFGESAAMGDPEPSFGAWRYLQVLLRERFPGTEFEVVSAAMTAINSHALLPMARECARRDGDLWILYLGNNEMVGPFGPGTVFGSRAPGTRVVRAALALKTTRLGQWCDALLKRWTVHASTPKTWGGLHMFENHQLRFDDPNRLRAYADFKKNLTDILRAGCDARVPIILSSVASNLKDCAPFASLHAAGLSEIQKAKWDEAYQGGIARESAGDWPGALDHYIRAAAIDPQFADLHFRLGNCRLALTNFPQAQREFELARDYDALAFRADSRINQIIKDAADASVGEGVYFLDAEQMLAQHSPANIPGNEVFYEHVHFNFTGNYLLGRALAEQTARLLPQSIAAQATNQWASAQLCDRLLAVSAWDRCRVWQEILNRVAEPLYNGQLTHAATVKLCEQRIGELRSQAQAEAPEQTRQLYQHALALAPNDSFLHQNFAEFLGARGELAQATVEAQRVCELLPYKPTQYCDLGNLLIIQGKVDEAMEYFSRALVIQRDFAPGLNGLGQILANQQKTEKAMTYFKEALHSNPNDPATFLNLGFLEQNRGNLNQAIPNYQNAARLQPQGPLDYFSQAVESSTLGRPAKAMELFGAAIGLKPDFWQGHYLLGLSLAAGGKIEEARAQFLEAARYRPDFAPAHFNLGLMLTKLEKSDQAMAEFRIVMQLEPTNSAARRYLDKRSLLQP